MLEDPKIQRLKDLTKLENPTDKELNELAELRKDLGLDERQEEESIEPIRQYHTRFEKNRKQREELGILKAQRKELETQLNIIKEKKRIARIKNELDGKVYCDDCRKWVFTSHFD